MTSTRPRIVIVGGVAGGMSAATRLRRLLEHADIVILERGDYVSFANCGLPYYVGGLIEDRAALLLQTPQSLAARFALDVRTRTEVVAIDAERQVVTIRNLATGTDGEEAYDYLVLATGAAARETTAPPGGVPVVNLRTIDDVDTITALLDNRPTSEHHAVVLGGGFIGLEAAENLRRRGVAVTMIRRGSQLLSPLDPEMAAPLLEHARWNGIDVQLGEADITVTSTGVRLGAGQDVDATIVVDARGVTPDTSLAADAGLRLGASGGIAVDAHHRTSQPRIFAVGDAAEKTDLIDGSGAVVTMAGLANRHGRAAADTIAAAVTDTASVAPPAAPALGTAIIGFFDFTAAFVGWNERRLRAAGRQHRVIHLHPAHHASYYPAAEHMAIKLLIDPATDRILGAQIVGGAGVDKRIDVIAVAMHAGLTASALGELELAYAPQYGTAKDPINLAGNIAENHATGLDHSTQWHELDDALAAGATLVDVRSAAEHDAGAIPGSILLPLDELRDRHGELPADLIVHCQVGQRGHIAARLLRQLGHRASNLDGGYLTWAAGQRASDAAVLSS